MPMKSWNDYKGILPYASELFGIYQPLLGWKSRLTGKRFDRFRKLLYRNIAEQALTTLRAPVTVRLDRAVNASAVGRLPVRIDNLKPIAFYTDWQPYISPTIDSGVARLMQPDLGDTPPKDWKRIVTTEGMTS